jgi:hypothetical protein
VGNDKGESLRDSSLDGVTPARWTGPHHTTLYYFVRFLPLLALERITLEEMAGVLNREVTALHLDPLERQVNDLLALLDKILGVQN